MTTPDAYSEYLQRHRYLWGDKGPEFRSRQRAEREWRERPLYQRIKMGHSFGVIVVTIMALVLLGCATPSTSTVPVHIDRAGLPTQPLHGYLQLCNDSPSEWPCKEARRVVIKETHDFVTDLRDASKEAWFDIPYRPDTGEDWQRPIAGVPGDCDEQTLHLVRLMVQQGYPQGAFTIARVVNGASRGHLIALAFTNRGIWAAEAARRGSAARLESFKFQTFDRYLDGSEWASWDRLIYPTRTAATNTQDRTQ